MKQRGTKEGFCKAASWLRLIAAPRKKSGVPKESWKSLARKTLLFPVKFPLTRRVLPKQRIDLLEMQVKDAAVEAPAQRHRPCVSKIEFHASQYCQSCI